MTSQPINTQNSWVDWLEVGLSALVRGIILMLPGFTCSSVMTVLTVVALSNLASADVFWAVGEVWVRLICGAVVGVAMWPLAWWTNRVLGLARLPIWIYPALIALAMVFAMLPSLRSGFSALSQQLSFLYLGMRVGMLCSMVIGILLRLRQHLAMVHRLQAEAARDALAADFIQSRTASLAPPRSYLGRGLIYKALCLLPVFVYISSLAFFGWEGVRVYSHSDVVEDRLCQMHGTMCALHTQWKKLESTPNFADARQQLPGLLSTIEKAYAEESACSAQANSLRNAWTMLSGTAITFRTLPVKTIRQAEVFDGATMMSDSNIFYVRYASALNDYNESIRMLAACDRNFDSSAFRDLLI